ncbi:MAG: NAD(+)/NADH kinase [Anaerolineales bacterium]
MRQDSFYRWQRKGGNAVGSKRDNGGFVGIIANPESGRDIRRLVGQAVTVDNNQKLNIMKRILLALASMGVERIEIMPDRFSIGQQSLQALARLIDFDGSAEIAPIEMDMKAGDSQRSAAYFAEQGAGCIIVLGGDGTCRVVAKEAADVPLLPISTGTNNVVPAFIEGTTAGLAAAFVAQHPALRHQICGRHKKLELWVNGEVRDQALVDIAVVEGAFTGASAVWEAERVRQIYVSRASPMSIGLSSVIGMIDPISPEEPRGAVIRLGPAGSKITAPLVPGKLSEVFAESIETLTPGEPRPLIDKRPAVIALDGEREIVLHPGDAAEVKLGMEGSWIVDVAKALTMAVDSNQFGSLPGTAGLL